MNKIVKRAFSLIEIIFALAVISIILIVAIPKLGDTLNNTNINKIKSDILIIREGLNNYKNKKILKGDTSTLESLEDDDQYLFNKILQNPIQSTSKIKVGGWDKTSTVTYRVYIEDGNSVEFVYDSDDYSFECDEDNLFCQELTQ
jgi:prepilin-type N-terminal cleavage/methylation domain-containing protein